MHTLKSIKFLHFHGFFFSKNIILYSKIWSAYTKLMSVANTVGLKGLLLVLPDTLLPVIMLSQM